jgi:hypothetical protein
MLAVHGHALADFISDHPVLTWLADCAYWALQKVDRTHYVARMAKKKSKVCVRCVGKIRKGRCALAAERGCAVVMCGHTHQAEAGAERGVRYFNSGCWRELPCTYLVVREGAAVYGRGEGGNGKWRSTNGERASNGGGMREGEGFSVWTLLREFAGAGRGARGG